MRDAEKNDWSMKVYDAKRNYLPSFIELRDGFLIIAPAAKNIGRYTMKIDLVDIFDYGSSYQF